MAGSCEPHPAKYPGKEIERLNWPPQGICTLLSGTVFVTLISLLIV